MTPTSKKIQTSFLNFQRSLAEHHVREALGHLDAMAAVCAAPWQMREEIENIRQSYSLLSDYAINGYEDPQRASVIADIYNRMRRVATAIIRHCEIPESPRQYFGILRFEQMQPDSSIAKIIDRYSGQYAELARSSFFGKKPDKTAATEADATARRLFNLVWTSYPLSGEDSAAIFEAAVKSQDLPDHFRLLLVSAVTLGILEYFDEEKLILLSRIYLSGARQVSMRALVGLLLGMWRHRDSLTGRRFIEAFATVKDSPDWSEDLRMAYMELVRTRDTERISRKLRDEIIPEMMKMRPEILKNMPSIEDAEEMMSLEENPEWAEMLDKSGLTEKLRELNDLQSDGSDVMMSTFAPLKGFSFFNDPANWFLPFFTEQSDVAAVLDDTAADIAEIIRASTAICDSDKYSIVLSLQQIPSANRRMMLSQFKLQDVNLAELRSSELNPEATDRKSMVNKYVQDLYRFFNLYRRKNEFPNPFASPINLAAVGLLADTLRNTDTLSLVGEFYFRRGYYRESLDVFSIIRESQTPSAELLQKIGYCHQQTANIDEAIKAYEQSRMLRPDSLWTLRRLAQCYRLADNNEAALECYREIERQKPDDINVATNLGHCLLSLGNAEEALKYYFKAEYLSANPSKVLRPIAWSLFLTGDYDRSADYYGRILASGPDATDYLNAGHLHMALKRYREALNFYRLSLENSPRSGRDEFLKNLAADRTNLLKAGVDNQMIDIVADAVIAS